MTKCNHHHSHKKADTWTNIATLGELVSSFISDAYWLGGLFDLATDCDKDFLELSRYAIIFGVIVAVLSASGAAYSHRALNTVHQKSTDDDGDEHIILLAQDEEHEEHEEHAADHAHNHLSKVQLAALVGDMISHTGDIAGPITFVVHLAMKSALPRWGEALVQCGATIFGALSTIANVRTCKDAMLEKNAHSSPGLHINP